MAAITDEQRARTLARFADHQRAWDSNAALRALYADWYGRIRAQLPDPGLGPWVELGSGPGFARRFIPALQLSDVVRAPWHDHEISADALPFAAGSLGALVLFDVLHHLAAPAAFFTEATRALAPGGRIILCEPYVSALSFPVYRWFHEEPLIMKADPFADHSADAESRDPFDSNQAIPTLMFAREGGRNTFCTRFPALEVTKVERLAGLAYPSSGGFNARPMLPFPLWRALCRIEKALPEWAFRLIGFRVLIVLRKNSR
ncbi:MAG TPA: methyltransferase domain-containing protein [Polyangia bacterium]|jgi:SAM-dependent methyltransferase